MELIEALEQLSLHVRSNQRNTKDSNQSERNIASTNISSTTNETYQLTAGHHQENIVYNDNDFLADEMDKLQLKEFDTSVEILLTQLVDLDVDSSETTSRHANPRDVRRTNLMDTRSAYHFNGSIETSQEEDSDNSSQQSGYANHKCLTDEHSRWRNKQGYHQISPLVSHLIQRELSSITNTVRKLGKILSIGHEIEHIFKGILQQQSLQNLDPVHCRALCNTFVDLCSSEPCICDLPTIIKYNDYCHMLLIQLDKFTNSHHGLYTRLHNPSTSQHLYSSTSSLSSNHYNQSKSSPNDHFLATTGENNASVESLNKTLRESESNEFDLMCLDDALDCALLECDQRQLDRMDSPWTNNKLYNSNTKP